MGIGYRLPVPDTRPIKLFSPEKTLFCLFHKLAMNTCQREIVSICGEISQVAVFKVKKNRSQTLMQHHNPCTAAAAALCVTDKAGAQPIGCSLSPHTRVCSQPATRSSGLPFKGLYPRNPCNYMVYYSYYRPRRDGRLSWPGWLTHSGHFNNRVVTCQPQIRRRSGKVRQLKTDVLTTEPCHHPVFCL